MITISVKDDLHKMTAQLGQLSDRQLRYPIATALTRAAFDSMNAIKAEMPKVFDRPTPWVVNSLKVDKATKDNLVAQVSFREFGEKSPSGATKSSKILNPEVLGGGRNQRGSERAISMRVAGERIYLTPGPGAVLDRYGNVPGSKYVQVMSYLQAFAQQGYIANRNKAGTRQRSKAQFFMVKPGEAGRLPAGIYERKGRGFRLIFHVTTKQPQYKKRFDFFGMGERIGRAAFARRFDEALREFLAKIRR